MFGTKKTRDEDHPRHLMLLHQRLYYGLNSSRPRGFHFGLAHLRAHVRTGMLLPQPVYQLHIGRATGSADWHVTDGRRDKGTDNVKI